MDLSSLSMGHLAMRWLQYCESGPVLIAVGLGLLIADGYCRAMPVISAVAIIALGATRVVGLRFGNSPARQALVAAHLVVYSSLYLLFVGAVIHAAFVKPAAGLSILQAMDLTTSALPIIASIRIALGSIAAGGDAPAR
jgi:hypothetical protein